MAKLKSLIKLEGTLDGLTFYKTKDGYLVRTKGGISKKRMATDPAFARTRENGSEFGHCAKMGKVLRKAMLTLLSDAKEGSTSTRIMQTLSRVKNNDATSVRGQRNVAVGLETMEGKALLKGFDFNTNAPLSTVLLADYALNTTTGEVTIADFIPGQQLAIPGGSTHVSLSAGFMNIDFSTDTKDLQLSNSVELPINNTAVAVVLTPAGVPVGTGNNMYFLKIAFYQELNGFKYPLNNGSFNTLQLIEVL